MSIDTALKNFADAFPAASENFGALEYRAFQPIVEPIPLGTVLKEYYGRLHMSGIPQVGGEFLMMLFSLDSLATAKHGWRWIRKNGGPVMDDLTWNKHWIVIGDRNGDAFVVDDSTTDGILWGHIGSYKVKIADALASFLSDG